MNRLPRSTLPLSWANSLSVAPRGTSSCAAIPSCSQSDPRRWKRIQETISKLPTQYISWASRIILRIVLYNTYNIFNCMSTVINPTNIFLITFVKVLFSPGDYSLSFIPTYKLLVSNNYQLFAKRTRKISNQRGSVPVFRRFKISELAIFLFHHSESN